MVGRSQIPGVPRVGDKETSDKFGHGANTSISNIASILHGHRLEVIPSKRASGTVLVRCKVEEVDVLVTAVVEVIVLARSRVDGIGSRDLGDDSGTCLSLHEFS